MQLVNVRSLMLAVILGFATVLTTLGTLGMASPALAQGAELEINAPVAQPPP